MADFEEKVLQMLGELNQRFDGIDQRLDGMDLRFDSIDQRLDGTDLRFDSIDQRLDGTDLRFDSIDQRLDGMDLRLDSMQQDLAEAKRDREIIREMVASNTEGLTSLHTKLDEIKLDQASTYEILGEHDVSIRTMRKFFREQQRSV